MEKSCRRNICVVRKIFLYWDKYVCTGIIFLYWDKYVCTALAGHRTKLKLQHIDKFDTNLKNHPSWLTFSRQRRIWSFHVLALQRTAKKFTKNYNSRTQPLFFSLFKLIKKFKAKRLQI